MSRPIKKRKRRSGLIVVPLIIISILAVLFLGMDQMCINDANRRMPYYPNATQIQESHNGLRIRGAGNTLEVVETSDSLDVVDAWYDAHMTNLLKNRKQLGINNLRHWFEESADPEGTKIFYLSQCIM